MSDREMTLSEALDANAPKSMSEKERAKLFARRDVDIDFIGSKITLPADPANMPLDTAIQVLTRKKADENQLMNVHEVLNGYPQDALVALTLAMREKYGWASAVSKIDPGAFGNKETVPEVLTIKVGPKPEDTMQVIHGQYQLPGVENPIETHFSTDAEGRPCLVITGEVRKKEREVVLELANIARRILRESSIYRGQAIRLRAEANGKLNTNREPEFLDTEAIRPDELILNPDEQNQLAASLWAAIQNTKACLLAGIPLNRGILLEGPYGTGKTMSAHVTSKICVENGWTYIVLDDVRALREALLFAQRYQPAVVFAEDIDRVIEVRDQEGNDLLNTIDGVLTKNSQVITVLTTNHVEKINKAMLRPGRLDAVITIRPPEAEAVAQLINLYGRGLVANGEDLSTVGEILAGNIPATIREVVERSKLAMIANGHTEVKAADLETAARGMARHLALLADQPEEPSLEHQVGDVMIRSVSKGVKDAIAADLQKVVDYIEE